MFKKLLVVVIVVASLAGLIGAAAALYTSTQSGTNVFTSGTVILTTTGPITNTFTLGNMAPGDEDYKTITVNNVGTLPLRYALTSAADNNDTLGLGAQLTMTIKLGVTACTSAGFNTDGSTLYGPAPFSSVAGINVIGDPATGAQGGEQTLAAAATQTLCLYVKLPLATGNAFQGATTTATFAFAAEQTANN